jgi:hypothetical protein
MEVINQLQIAAALFSQERRGSICLLHEDQKDCRPGVGSSEKGDMSRVAYRTGQSRRWLQTELPRISVAIMTGYSGVLSLCCTLVHVTGVQTVRQVLCMSL